MNFSLNAFLNVGYWFGEPTSLRRETLVVYVAVLGLFILIGIVCRVIAGNKALPGVRRGIFRRWSAWAFVMAAVGIVFTFFRYEYVPLLRLRVWFGLWALGAIGWAAFLIVHARERLMRAAEKPALDPYLPQHKK